MVILSKICSSCKDNKIASEFSKNRANKDGYDHYCKKCKSIWLKEHKTNINKRRVTYRHEKGISKFYGSGNGIKNPKKAQHYKKLRISKNGKAYTWDWVEIRKVIYKRDNWVCQICGIKCHGHGTKDKIQCHHIDNNSLNNNSNNLITLCASCHMRLHSTISDKWRELVKQIIIKKVI